MASLTNRNGTYYARHVYYVNGKRKEKKESLETKDEKTARRRLARWAATKAAEKWGEAAPVLFDEATRRFRMEHMKLLRKGGAQRYEDSLKHLDKFFAGRRIDSITKVDLLGFESRRRMDPGRGGRGKISASSIRADFACLSSMLNFCIAKEWIEFNPVQAYLKTRKKVLKHADPRERYLSHDEEAMLLHAALNGPQDNRNLSQLHHDMIAFAIETGLRQEEQLVLEWRDLQFGDMPYVAVRDGKGGKGRKVPLSERAQMLVTARPQHPTSPFVWWWGRKGKRLGSMKKGFASISKRAGLQGIQWHDLRRTCGCRLLQDRGASIYDVSKWLGHSSVRVTEKHYAFLRLDDLHKLVNGPVQLDRRPLNVVPLGPTRSNGSHNHTKQDQSLDARRLRYHNP